MSLALHLRALGRRNGSNTLAPCHDLSFRQQCWSLLQTRFLVGLPRQVFLEIIILYESGVGEGAVRSAGRRARKERRPSCSGRKPSHGAERCWRSCSCPAPAPLLPPPRAKQSHHPPWGPPSQVAPTPLREGFGDAKPAALLLLEPGEGSVHHVAWEGRGQTRICGQAAIIRK